MNFAIYARKSVYRDNSDSTMNQIHMCRDYIDRFYLGKVETVSEYEDEGFSGATTDRPAFEKLMNDIKHHRIDVLVMYKMDRISRNITDFVKIFDFLKEHNVEFVSISENIQTDTPMGRAMLYILSVFAQMEREQTSQRIRDNLSEMAKGGKWTGGVEPLGYHVEKRRIDGKEHSILVEDPETSDIVKKIFALSCKGKTTSTIARELRKHGYYTRKGNAIYGKTVWIILKNPLYAQNNQEMYDYFSGLGCQMAQDRDAWDGTHGISAYAKLKNNKPAPYENWIVSSGMNPPLISSSDWLTAQQVFVTNKKMPARKYNVGLLRGILRCKCGNLLAVRVRGGEREHRPNLYATYFCQKRKNLGEKYCGSASINVKEMDDYVLELLKDIAQDKRLLKNFSLTKKDTMYDVKRKSTLQKKIKTLNGKIENLTAALSNNTSSAAAKYMIETIETLDEELSAAKQSLLEVTQKEIAMENETERLETTWINIRQFVDRFDTLSFDEKNRLLRQIIKECRIDEDDTLHILF